MLKYICLASVLFAAVQSEVPDECVKCICEGATGCDLEFPCEADVCGPYKFTYYYWVDAGKPVVDGDKPSDSDAFKNCALNYDCATETVKKYLQRYQRDCNSDGKIDCVDNALLHRFGGIGCYDHSLPEDIWTDRFQECQNAK